MKPKTGKVFTSKLVQFHEQIFRHHYLNHATPIDVVSHDKLVSDIPSLNSTFDSLVAFGLVLVSPIELSVASPSRGSSDPSPPGCFSHEI